jgi:hypothetical protein
MVFGTCCARPALIPFPPGGRRLGWGEEAPVPPPPEPSPMKGEGQFTSPSQPARGEEVGHDVPQAPPSLILAPMPVEGEEA